MNKNYFENYLKVSGMWAIYKWQTVTRDPKDFYVEMMRRPMLHETENALETIIGEFKKIRNQGQRSITKEMVDRMVDLSNAFNFCKLYLQKTADVIADLQKTFRLR